MKLSQKIADGKLSQYRCFIFSYDKKNYHTLKSLLFFDILHLKFNTCFKNATSLIDCNKRSCLMREKISFLSPKVKIKRKYYANLFFFFHVISVRDSLTFRRDKKLFLNG